MFKSFTTRRASRLTLSLLLPVALSAISQAQVTRDDFTGGFRPDLVWSFQSPLPGAGLVGSQDPARMSFSATQLQIQSNNSSNILGSFNSPINLPNLTVTAVPQDWYVETSVQMNLADLTDRTRFTGAQLIIYRDADYLTQVGYLNSASTATPTSFISTNTETTATNGTYGGFSTSGFPSDNLLQVQLRVERKTAGSVPGFVLGGTNSGIYLGVNLGTGWNTFASVLNGTGDVQKQRTYNVLSQVAPGYRIGLAANATPTSGPIPVARFDYLETNLTVASGPEPGVLALFITGCLPLAGMLTRRRKRAVS